MLKQRLFGMLTLIVGTCLVFGFAACDTGNSNGGGGGIPAGDYILSSGNYSTPQFLGGLQSTTDLSTSNQYSQVSNPTYSKVTIGANNVIGFSGVGSSCVVTTQGEGTSMNLWNTKMKYAADGGGYKVMLDHNNSADLFTITGAYSTQAGYPGVDFAAMATFTYASNVITLVMRYEKADERTQGWTQTYTFAK